MASKQRSLANLAALIDSASGSTIDFGAALIADTLSGNGAGLSGVTSYTQADHDSDTLAQVNAAYVQARQTTYNTSDFVDSSTVQNVIDATYIQANQTTYSNLSEFTNDTNYLDSSTVTGVINSSYVQSNQTTYSTADFPDSSGVNSLVSSYLTTNSYATQSYVGTQINNLIDGAPGTLDTLNEIAAALNDDDSAYGTLLGLISAKDSDYVKTAITPSYIQANQTTYSTADFADSAFVTAQIAASAVDSAQVQAIVDSDYFRTLLTTTSNTYDNSNNDLISSATTLQAAIDEIAQLQAIHTQTLTADSGDTTFALSTTFDSNASVSAYLNGIKLLQTTDFDATSGNSIVLSEAADSGDTLDVIIAQAYVNNDAVQKSSAKLPVINKAGSTVKLSLNLGIQLPITNKAGSTVNIDLTSI